MHFRVAVKNFHVFNASRWVPHMVVVTISRIVVVRRPEQLPLWLPNAIKSLIPKETSHNLLMIATRATTLWLKQPTCFFSVGMRLCSTSSCLVAVSKMSETMHVLNMVYSVRVHSFHVSHFSSSYPMSPFSSQQRHIYLRPGVGALQKVYGGKHSKHADQVIHKRCVVCTSIAGNL